VFHRLSVLWTPTVVILDPSGTERRRSEGYLPRDEFFAELHLGLARVAVMRKQWADAERFYEAVIERFPQTNAAPEAVYWRGVCRYKRTNDHRELPAVAAQFERQYQETLWAKKASIWRP
jgi:outer membrane protein assembly factor BamD (BamD/ComL family)